MAPTLEDPGRMRWARRPDPKLPAYLVAGFGALVVAIGSGRPEIAALGAPFLVLAAVGLTRRGPDRLSGHVDMSVSSAVEGDLLDGEVTVDWDGTAEVDVILAGWRGVVPVSPTEVVGWSLPPGRGPVTLPFSLQARSWGVHSLGALWVRAKRPGGYTSKEQKVNLAPTIRVFPTPLRLARMLKPAEPRTVAGMHLARVRGSGTDFVEMRPYQPGDRFRDISWSTSARMVEPWVRVNHPERTGTVVILLDAVFSDEKRSKEALARAARAAWAVASVHLRAQDRVGLLARGRTVAWLPPRGGRRARWMLLEKLLGVGRAAEDLLHRKRARSRIHVPADALVVGVSTLRSQVFAPDLLHYRRAGHTTVAMVVDISDLLPAGKDPAGTAARRIWLAQREVEHESLERGGVPTSVITADGGAGPAILALRRRLDASRKAIVGGVAEP